MSLNSLAEIVKRSQKNYPLFSLRLCEAEALGRWEQAVGPLIAKHAKAVRVVDKILFVEVEHPIWRAELHARKQQILEILNGKRSGATLLTPPREVLRDIYYLRNIFHP